MSVDSLQTVKELIISIIGEYEPNLGPNGEVLGGLYSIDFLWIGSFILLCLMVFISFRGFISVLRAFWR